MVSFNFFLLQCCFMIPFRETTLVESVDSRSCLDLLEEYATQSSNFTKCFIKHARPITVCQKCVQNYVSVIESYINITKLEGDMPSEICRAELINVDRLEVIVNNFKYVTHQWERAMCSKCLETNSTALNRKTTTILGYLETTEKCISHANSTSHSHEQICSNCSDSYSALNDFYDNEGSYTEFCMDVIDAMNTSRVLWSITLGCCSDRQTPEILFLITVIVVLLIPILFYLLVWICSKVTPSQITYQERWTRRFLQKSANSS